MKKRAVSVLLALALCLGLTVFASAEDQSDETPADPFTDVAEDAYYAQAVNWALERGITSGTTPTTFSPGATCTTGQILTFLWRANGSPVVDYAMSFTDVAEGQWYAEAVRWARWGVLIAVWWVGRSARPAVGFAPTLARIRGNKYRTCARCRRKKFFYPPLGGQDSSQNGLFRHDTGNRAMIFASGGQGGKPSGPPANQSTGGKGYAGQGHERSRASRAQGGIAQG